MRSILLPSTAVAAATSRRRSSNCQELVRLREEPTVWPRPSISSSTSKGVAVDNADVGTCGFLTNAKVETVLAKAKDSQIQYLFSPYGIELGRSQIAGRRFQVSNNVPSTPTKGFGTDLFAVIYCNFVDLLIALYPTLEILVDPHPCPSQGVQGRHLGSRFIHNRGAVGSCQSHQHHGWCHR